jgi:choline kinase
MEVIVPAAGLSSRFPGMKPKYLLYDYKGRLMIENAISGHLTDNITIGILKEHDDEFQASVFLHNELSLRYNIRIVILNERTKGPADTVYQIIKKSGMNLADSIYIKDCDSFFHHDKSEGNYVCTSNIADHMVLKKLSSKSFVVVNNQDIITNIVEKSVVSDTFCVGGYKFDRADIFTKAFEFISKSQSEIYVSHVIQHCMMNGHTFTKKIVTDYTDVGTAEDWFEYNDKPVIFCDIDGTIIKAQARYGENSYDDTPIVLEENVKILKRMYENGSEIIFTTSRPHNARSRTMKMLNGLGFSSCQLLTGLNNSRRILINDYNNANPYPRAEAFNIKRDSDTLKDTLK